MDIGYSFTDRYGNRRPPVWTACLGDCETMGAYPVSGSGDLTPHERAEVQRLTATHGPSEDGWYFVRCPDCRGTGRAPWWLVIRNAPRILRNQLRTRYLIWSHPLDGQRRPSFWWIFRVIR